MLAEELADFLQGCVGTSDKKAWKPLTYSGSDIWNGARCETVMTQSQNKSVQMQLLSSHKSSSIQPVGIQVIWLIYPVLPWQCQPLLTLEGRGWPLDSKHTRVETITMAMVWTPCQYQGPVGPSCPALSTPSMVHGRSPWVGYSLPPHRSWPQVCDWPETRGVLGSWPYKKTLESGLQEGEVMGCNCLSVWEDIITGTGQIHPDYKEAYK